MGKRAGVGRGEGEGGRARGRGCLIFFNRDSSIETDPRDGRSASGGP